MFWGLEKQDLTAFIVLLFCLIKLPQVLFGLAAISAIVVSLGLTNKNKNSTGFKMPDPFFFYILGVGLLCFLLYNIDINTIGTALSEVGIKIIWVFAAAILWILVNTHSVSVLVDKKVPFKTLLYADLTGNAYNNIIPFAGVGGEPYKVKVMSEYIGVNNASRVAVQNRLINSSTAFIFTSIMAIATVITLDLNTKVHNLFLAAGIISAIIGLAISFVSISNLPDKILSFVFKKSQFLKDYKIEQLPKKTFLIAAFWQLIGRALNMVEIYAIFIVLNFDPSLAHVLCISAFLSITGAVFFMIPQGLGVSEAGIQTAFSILGYDTSLGMTFGLIRRARVIFWALLGIAIHITYLIIEKSFSQQKTKEGI